MFTLLKLEAHPSFWHGLVFPILLRVNATQYCAPAPTPWYISQTCKLRCLRLFDESCLVPHSARLGARQRQLHECSSDNNILQRLRTAHSNENKTCSQYVGSQYANYDCIECWQPSSQQAVLRVFAVATWQDYPAESGLACSDPIQSQCGDPAWFAGKSKLVSQCPSWQHQLPAFESTPSHHNVAPGRPSPWIFTVVDEEHHASKASSDVLT